jgi:hypothetical protein
MTLGKAAGPSAEYRWCRDFRHQGEPDPAELARRYGANTAVPDWRKRLVCSRCGGRAVDFVLTEVRGEVRVGLQTITQG